MMQAGWDVFIPSEKRCYDVIEILLVVQILKETV